MTIHRRKKRAILGFVFAGGVVALVLVGSARYFSALEERQLYEEEKANLSPREPNIVIVQPESSSRVREFTAEILPWAEARVSAEVAGNVMAVHVERGSVVGQGETLLDLDHALAGVESRAAAANFGEAERLMAEAERLAASNVASSTELEAARARLAIARAENDRAEEIFSRHTIRSPFPGVVSDRFVDVGDAVQPGSPVAVVEDFSRFRILFSVNEFEIDAFPEGRMVSVMVPSLGGRKWDAVVRFVGRSADRATRLFRVEALFEDPPEGFRSGLQAVVRAEVDVFNDTLFVPAAAVRIEGRRARVVVQSEDGSELVRIVEIGPETDGRYPVLGGLEAGERIVLR